MPTPIEQLTALEQAESRKLHAAPAKVVPEVAQADEGPVAPPAPPVPKPVPVAKPVPVPPSAPPTKAGSDVPSFLRHIEDDLELAAKKLEG